MKMTRIAVLIDGQYYFQVTNHYKFSHPLRQRFSVSGLLDYFKSTVKEKLQLDSVTISHAFSYRGRYNAYEAEINQRLKADRVFEDILTRAGITSKFTLLDTSNGAQEKGIDVMLALDAYELAFRNQCDVVCIVAGDADYVPLVKKLNELGVPTVVFAWQLSSDKNNVYYSVQLSQFATHFVLVSKEIDDQCNNGNKEWIEHLFLQE